MDGESLGSILTKTQRLFLGTLVLILVDVIWVSSSELTKYIYKNETFEKPFFCTYIKTSMFTMYLLGFCFWPPWRDYCQKPHNYVYLESDQDEDTFTTTTNPDSINNGSQNGLNSSSNSLSNPIYVPIKTASSERDFFDRRGSGTESDDSALSAAVQRSVRFSKLAEVRHMSEIEATEALLARLSYQASVRAGEMAKRAAVKLPVVKVAKIAFIFCILWFIANYTFQVALAEAEAGLVTVLSSTSSLFTLVLAGIFPSNSNDHFSLSKLLSVILSIAGVILVSLSEMSMNTQIPVGVVLSLFSAFFYALYIVFLRRKVDHEDKMDIPLFFGFVGLFNLILLWPLFFFLHYSQLEKFELPSKHQFMFLLLNGLLGTVVSEVLWLWGCFLTSSLIATIAISLTIPMTMLADVLLKRISYPYLFYVGTVPMIAAFVCVSLLSHYERWDPVMSGLRWTYRIVTGRHRMRFRFPDMQSEQTEALIGINSNEMDA